MSRHLNPPGLMEQAFANVKIALEAAEARLDQVVSIPVPRLARDGLLFEITVIACIPGA